MLTKVLPARRAAAIYPIVCRGASTPSRSGQQGRTSDASTSSQHESARPHPSRASTSVPSEPAGPHRPDASTSPLRESARPHPSRASNVGSQRTGKAARPDASTSSPVSRQGRIHPVRVRRSQANRQGRTLLMRVRRLYVSWQGRIHPVRVRRFPANRQGRTLLMRVRRLYVSRQGRIHPVRVRRFPRTGKAALPAASTPFPASRQGCSRIAPPRRRLPRLLASAETAEPRLGADAHRDRRSALHLPDGTLALGNCKSCWSTSKPASSSTIRTRKFRRRWWCR